MNYYNDKYCSISVLKGAVLESIEGDKYSDELRFNTVDGKQYLMTHDQDCCESVTIEDIIGNLDDLVGSPILMAEEVSDGPDEPLREYEESYTWTFYKLATVKGYVTIRWYGSSNGYYSESVDFYLINGKKEKV